jgi:hypothetical protein
MSKIHGTNVHILPDENLGGVLREYVEVDRKAEIGEKIIVTNAYMNGSYYDKGDIFTVIERYDFSSSERPDCIGVYVKEIDDDYGIRDYEYKTLEPTDIVHIDDARYRLVDRKAKVGEKVMHYNDGKSDGVITTCIGYSEFFDDVINVEPYWSEEDNEEITGFTHGYYRVLEIVEPTELVTAEEGDDKSILDLLANLARRVTELERKLDGIVDLKRKEYDAYEKLFTGIDEKIEMLIDDVAMLDERTQPLATKKPSVAVAVRSIQQEFDGVFTKTEIDAYVESEGFCLNGTFEFKGSVKGPNDAAEKISEVFK